MNCTALCFARQTQPIGGQTQPRWRRTSSRHLRTSGVHRVQDFLGQTRARHSRCPAARLASHVCCAVRDQRPARIAGTWAIGLLQTVSSVTAHRTRRRGVRGWRGRGRQRSVRPCGGHAREPMEWRSSAPSERRDCAHPSTGGVTGPDGSMDGPTIRAPGAGSMCQRTTVTTPGPTVTVAAPPKLVALSYHSPIRPASA